MASNTAIFYDIENLVGLFAKRANTGLHLNEIYRRVLECEGVTGVSIQRAYADWGIPANRDFCNSVLEVGIEPIQIFNTNQNDRVKNAADVCLIIDVIDLAARRSDIDTFVIASGDGIFAFLSKKLHEHGKRVIGCSFGAIANSIFRNSCDAFIAIEKAGKDIIATAHTRSLSQSVQAENTTPAVAASTIPATATTAKPASKKQALVLPKSKYTEAVLAAEIDPETDMRDSSGIMHTLRKMVEAIFVEETQALPGLEISIFTNYITHFMPGFKVRHLKFKGIGELMRFILTGSPYCTYTVADNAVLMGTREAAASVQGKIIEDVSGLIVTTIAGERYNSIFNVPDDTPFLYTVQKQPKNAKQTKAEEVQVVEPPPLAAPENVEHGKLRKWIRSKFEALQAANSLPASQTALLTTREYSVQTFGVRAPILRAVDPQNIARETRIINGKVKYWKEPFEFNGEFFIVYKEWANLHKDRFAQWCATYLK